MLTFAAFVLTRTLSCYDPSKSTQISPCNFLTSEDSTVERRKTIVPSLNLSVQTQVTAAMVEVAKDCLVEDAFPELVPPPSPRALKKSFASVISGSSTMSALPKRHPSTYRGEPAAVFSKEEIQVLLQPLKFVLIGKFSSGCPKMDLVRNFFTYLGLKKGFKVGSIDCRHILIHLNGEEDYNRLFSKFFWVIDNHEMRVLKWTPEFDAVAESSISSVWINLPGLPYHFFEKSALFRIASTIGAPMKMDEPTVNKTRPSVARFCVEFDMKKPKPDRIWIGDATFGFWQKVVFENAPPYCNVCAHLGHDEKNCRKKFGNVLEKDRKQDSLKKTFQHGNTLQKLASGEHPGRLATMVWRKMTHSPELVVVGNEDSQIQLVSNSNKIVNEPIQVKGHNLYNEDDMVMDTNNSEIVVMEREKRWTGEVNGQSMTDLLLSQSQPILEEIILEKESCHSSLIAKNVEQLFEQQAKDCLETPIQISNSKVSDCCFNGKELVICDPLQHIFAGQDAQVGDVLSNFENQQDFDKNQLFGRPLEKSNSWPELSLKVSKLMRKAVKLSKKRTETIAKSVMEVPEKFQLDSSRKGDATQGHASQLVSLDSSSTRVTKSTFESDYSVQAALEQDIQWIKVEPRRSKRRVKKTRHFDC